MVGAWRVTVDRAFAEETRKGAGGDVVVFSTEPFSSEVLRASEDYHSIRTSEMFTVALAPRPDKTLFSKLKAVEADYPFYGEVPLSSGEEFQEALKRGVVLERRALERLEIEVGDSLKIGETEFVVSGVALSEPDRPLGMWGVSPRIFVSFEQLEASGLVRPDSYLERRIHVKLEQPETASSVADKLRESAVPDQERVETWERPPVNMEGYIGNFFTFLDLQTLLALVLGGLGMQSTLSSWVRTRQHAVATLRAVGADSGFIIRHFVAATTLVTLGGFLVGLSMAAGLLEQSAGVLSEMLPIQVDPQLSLRSVTESLVLCLAVTGAFSVWPFYELSGVKPSLVLREQNFTASSRAKRVFGLGFYSLYCLSLWATLSQWRAAMWVAIGTLILAMFTALTVKLAIKFLKARRPRFLPLRMALSSWRTPEVKIELVVMVLVGCLTVLFTTVICERALSNSWVEAMPPESPNLLFLDIQPHQLDSFRKEAEVPLELYRHMRVRIQAVNGKPLVREGKREYWQRDGRGKIEASPVEELPTTDTIVEGEQLFLEGSSEQVSIRDDLAKALKIGVGDVLTFGIQGVPIEAKVSSVRHSERTGFKPRFQLLFPPELVEGAPQTIFATTRLDVAKIGTLQTRLAKRFPGIVSMDLSEAIRLVAERLFQMLNLINYFLFMGLTAGLVILISAIWAAKARRTREVAYFKVMGADTRFITLTIALENLILGTLCSGLSLLLASLVSGALCYWKLDIDFPWMPRELLLMFTIPTLLIASLAWVLTKTVIDSHPAPALKHE